MINNLLIKASNNHNLRNNNEQNNIKKQFVIIGSVGLGAGAGVKLLSITREVEQVKNNIKIIQAETTNIQENIKVIEQDITDNKKILQCLNQTKSDIEDNLIPDQSKNNSVGSLNLLQIMYWLNDQSQKKILGIISEEYQKKCDNTDLLNVLQKIFSNIPTTLDLNNKLEIGAYNFGFVNIKFDIPNGTNVDAQKQSLITYSNIIYAILEDCIEAKWDISKLQNHDNLKSLKAFVNDIGSILYIA